MAFVEAVAFQLYQGVQLHFLLSTLSCWHVGIITTALNYQLSPLFPVGLSDLSTAIFIIALGSELEVIAVDVL